MGDAQVRNTKPMGVSFTVSLSLHLMLLLIIFALGGTGGSRPSLSEVLIVGLVAPAGDERVEDKTSTKPEDRATVREKVFVPDAIPNMKKVETKKEISSIPMMKEEDPAEETVEIQETEKDVMVATQNELVLQTMEQAGDEEFYSEAVSAEPKAEKEEIQEFSAVPKNVARRDGPGNARTDYLADTVIEIAGSDNEGQGTGVDAHLFALIKQRITAAVRYPYLARIRGMEGTVFVEFSVAEDGNPTDIDITRSSGHKLLDSEAERTIKRASPYPSLNEKIEVPVTFRLTEGRIR